MSLVSLEFTAVSKWYGQISALTQLSLSIGPGVTGLVGQNGAGKSTLLKLACGVLRPSLGEVRVCGAAPQTTAVRRRIGYCPDLDRFYERLTGLQFVTWMLRLGGIAGAEARRRATATLVQLGLGEAMHRGIAGYSLGMRQRVKLAQAFAHEPDVVLLDEPLTGLDPVARHEIAAQIHALGARGAAVLVSSHVLHELQNVAERFVLMHQGRLLADGKVSDLRAQLADRPRRVFVASPAPRVLAARLCSLDEVAGVEIGAAGVELETSGGTDLWRELTRIGAGSEGLVVGVTPLDDSLEAVFGYLVS